MRTVEIKLLRDEQGRVTDRVCIHWFVRDENGPAETPKGVLPSSRGPLFSGGVRGYLACQKARKDVTPQTVGGIIQVTVHSDDVRAATCPACLATPEAKAMLHRLEELVPAPAYPAAQ